MDESFDSGFETYEDPEPACIETTETDLGEMFDSDIEDSVIFESNETADSAILAGLDGMDTIQEDNFDDISANNNENLTAGFETYDYETKPEKPFSIDPEKVGEFVSAENPYADQWEQFSKDFSDGSNDAEAWDSLKDVPFAGNIDLHES